MALATARSSALLAERVRELPTLPVVALKVNELVQNPRSTVAELASVIKNDPPLTSKILRLANSSYYSIPGGAKEVGRAMQYLGFNTLAQITLGVSVFSLFQDSNARFDLKKFWRHSIGVGLAAEMAAKASGYAHSSEAFTAGLLHDIGKLALLKLDSKRFQAVLDHAFKSQGSFIQAEEALGGESHAMLGQALCQRWGFPETLSQAVGGHHEAALSDAFSRFVQFGNEFMNTKYPGESGSFKTQSAISPELLSGVGIQDFKDFETKFNKEEHKIGAFLNAVS